MKLFRLFLLLLVLSLAGVAVTQYLRKSAGTEIALEQPAAPAAKSLGSGSDAPVARSVTRNAYSQNVDVASSVSSACGPAANVAASGAPSASPAARSS